jgi:hypothetical protein
MNNIPVFFNPFSQNFQVPQLQQMVEMEIRYPAMYNVYNGGIPVHMVVQQQVKRIEYVGCVFINRSSSSRVHDIIMVKSDLHVYEAFGITIAGNFTPVDAMNTILNKIGYRCSSSTPFIDMENPINGKLCRIYVINCVNFSCTASTNSIAMQHSLRNAFTNFARFPVDIVFNDSIRAPLSSFSRKILRAVSSDFHKFL